MLLTVGVELVVGGGVELVVGGGVELVVGGGVELEVGGGVELDETVEDVTVMYPQGWSDSRSGAT